MKGWGSGWRSLALITSRGPGADSKGRVSPSRWGPTGGPQRHHASKPDRAQDRGPWEHRLQMAQGLRNPAACYTEPMRGDRKRAGARPRSSPRAPRLGCVGWGLKFHCPPPGVAWASWRRRTERRPPPRHQPSALRPAGPGLDTSRQRAREPANPRATPLGIAWEPREKGLEGRGRAPASSWNRGVRRSQSVCSGLSGEPLYPWGPRGLLTTWSVAHAGRQTRWVDRRVPNPNWTRYPVPSASAVLGGYRSHWD